MAALGSRDEDAEEQGGEEPTKDTLLANRRARSVSLQRAGVLLGGLLTHTPDSI